MDERDETGEEDDPVTERAAFWVVRLSSPEATEADRAAFAAWHGADPAHADAFAEMQAWRRAAGQAADPRKRRRRLPKVVMGFAAALGVCALAGYESGLIDRLRADAWTGVGDIVTTELPDGSRAALNTDTALAVRFTLNERGVTLLRGEAMFDVVPDTNRPFVVRGGGLRVRAVGTRFFVRAGDTPEPVGVAEGRVEASTSAGGVTIAAGEFGVREGEGRLTVERGDVERATAWRRGTLIASGRPLAEIVAELNRYRRGRIVLTGAGLGAQRFSGTLDLRDTDDALDLLATTMGLRVTRLTPFLVLLGASS